MSDFLKLVKRLHDAALDLYHQPRRSHVPVDRSDLLGIVEDWRRLDSEYRSERLEVIRLKTENEALRKDAERYRWLRDSSQYDWDVSYGKLELRIETPHIDASSLDACIDAAMAQGEQP